jgi:molecular chaperone DnaJ
MAAQREWFDKDYYKVLGVPENASQKEITKAYRKLAREHHPDANAGDRAAEERFKEVSAAYDVLGDDAKRKEYDELRRLGPIGGFGAGPGPGPGGVRYDVGGEGFGDLLNNLFGGAGRRRGASGVGPQRGADLEAELTLDFEDAVHGITTTLYLTSDAVCSTCEGSGARPGTTPHTCRVCNGRGVVDDNQGFFSFSSPCTACQGRGVTIDDPCPRVAARGSSAGRAR